MTDAGGRTIVALVRSFRGGSRYVLHPRCLLCERPAADDYVIFDLPPEVQVLLTRPQGRSPGEFLRDNVVCKRCASTPAPGQQERLVQVIRREVALFILRRSPIARRRTFAH